MSYLSATPEVSKILAILKRKQNISKTKNANRDIWSFHFLNMTKKSVIASGFCIKSAWASFFCELLHLCLNMTNVAKNVRLNPT
ncbi:hypothetical protein [Helicobacter sp. T3_23-1059]